MQRFFTVTFIMRYLSLSLLLCTVVLGNGCSAIIDSQLSKFADNLSDTLLNFEDPATVAGATPTLLIVVDSMASGDKASADLKLSAAQMYGAYSGAFVDHSERTRQQVLTRRGLAYARDGSCKKDRRWCAVPGYNSAEFSTFVASLETADVPVAYAYASAWLAYIQAHSDDWSIIADLSRARELLQFVVAHNEGWDNAGAHLYLGAIATTLPPALGGKPEIGKAHFERALELTDNRHLLVKVEYARRYARLTFDQDLHHRLLTDVVEADIKAPDLTLMNAWAQQQAHQLLATEAEYFE